MRHVFLALALTVCAFGQTRAKAITDRPKVVVFAGDNVIPQVVDGAGWKTTFKFVNLQSTTVKFNLYFFADNGSDLNLPIIGVGTVRGLVVTLNPAGSITIETGGDAAALAQGWALIQRTNIDDSIGGFAIFRQRIAGIPDQEAVVPVVDQFSGHFMLLFDNTAFTTGIAIANPTPGQVSIPVTIRDEQGQIIDSKFIALGPYEHVAFSAPALWPSTAGKAGTVEFTASGFGVAALGLRFNGPAFTSFDVLENFNWLPTQ